MALQLDWEEHQFQEHEIRSRFSIDTEGIEALVYVIDIANNQNHKTKSPSASIKSASGKVQISTSTHSLIADGASEEPWKREISIKLRDPASQSIIIEIRR